MLRCARETPPFLLRCARETDADVSMSRRYFVYILANRPKGVLYVGVTNDLARRIWEHRTKVVAGFTSKYRVTTLVYFEEYSSVLEARTREGIKALAPGLEIEAN